MSVYFFWRFSTEQFACTLLEGKDKKYTMRVCIRGVEKYYILGVA